LYKSFNVIRMVKCRRLLCNICGLFNDAASTSDCIESNYVLINE
jgi:hypothetical protein